MKKNRKKLLLILAFFLAITLTMSAVAETYPKLRPGDSGDAVLRLQKGLNQLGFSVGTADGKYGPKTQSAVRAFQQRYGLTVDGLAGPKTQQKLYSILGTASSNTTVTTTTTMSSQSTAMVINPSGWFSGNYATIESGQKGDRVRLLQAALKKLGYYTGAVDGSFGSGTRSAVKSFQKSAGLTQDGKAGTKTLTKIEARLGNDNTSAAALSYMNSVSSQTVQQQTTNATNTANTTNTTNTTTQTTVQPVVTVSRPNRTLRFGNTGDDVRALQTRLAQIGYYTGTVNGSYDQQTMEAVIRFQAVSGLETDGVAGNKTYNKLFTTTAQTVTNTTPVQSDAPTVTTVSDTNTTNTTNPTNTTNNTNTTNTNTANTANTTDTTTTLRPGASGSSVTQMQTNLRALGYDLTINGSYDTATEAAVRAFQSRNSLSVDGIAGPKTLTKLYSGTALGPSAAATTTSFNAPSIGQVKLLHWFNDVKPTLKNGQTLLVYDPATGISWRLRVYSRGRHCDCEPLTLEDTQNMVKAFGGKNTWDQKAVYVQLPSGVWSLASTHDMPHDSGSIKDNGFNGHLCVHFLRDMDECKKNDPNYGVANQNTIRAKWKEMTGEVIP